jgi:hypothetical protein
MMILSSVALRPPHSPAIFPLSPHLPCSPLHRPPHPSIDCCVQALAATAMGHHSRRLVSRPIDIDGMGFVVPPPPALVPLLMCYLPV